MSHELVARRGGDAGTRVADGVVWCGVRGYVGWDGIGRFMCARFYFFASYSYLNRTQETTAL
jgi:hypothetical protein